MSMLNWAENEVRIACERERKNSKNPNEWNYGCTCYESALKAFKSLLEDEHSGYSIGITKSILNKLIDAKALTPIEDTEDVWNYVTSYYPEDLGINKSFQCKRMSSLFKDVLSDGSVKYHDVDRFICENVNDPSDCWHNGFVSNLMHDIYPIKMPYMPESKSYRVICEEFLTDRKNGDFDTLAIFDVIKPNGIIDSINRYFKESSNGWDEIPYEEYSHRVDMHNERENEEKVKMNSDNR